MSKRFLTTQKIVNLATDPESGSAGEIYYNSTNNSIKYYNGSTSSWAEVGGGGVTVSGTSPVSPSLGDLWFDDTNLKLFIYYDATWIEAGGGGGSTASIYVAETPDSNPEQGDLWFNSNNAKTYVYYDSTWVEIGGGGITPTNSFETISVPNGTSPVADSQTDILSFTESNGIIITGTASADSISFSTNATSLNTASKIISRDTDRTFDITGIDFDTSASAIAAAGRLKWDDGEGTLSLGLKGGNVSLQVGEENVVLCYNGTGSVINNGSVVYISGAQGQRPSIALADSDLESTSTPVLGIATEDIANGEEGFVTTFGLVNDVNTSAFTPGDVLFLSSTPGQMTATKPVAPQHLIIVGYCVKSHKSSGRIFVSIKMSLEIEELHNVLINGIADNNILTYSSASSLWTNQPLVDAIKEIDGTGSGIDADLLDGQHGSYYLDTSASAQTKSGDLTIGGNLTVQGTTTFIDTVTLQVEDKNIEIGKVASPTDITADGGGITLLGTTNKTFNWVDLTDSWTSSEHIDLASGKVIKINGTQVLSATQYTGNAATATNADTLDGQHGSYYAPINSPIFTGTVTVPTPVNNTDAATKGYVDSLTPTELDGGSPSTSATSIIDGGTF